MLHALIADDHAIVRKGLKQIILEDHPSAQVDEAGDAETMLKKASEQFYDVIICDINMPGRTGMVHCNNSKSKCRRFRCLL